MWQRHPRRAWARREDPRCKVGRHADDRDALLPVAPCAPGTAHRVNCRYAMSPFFWGGFQMAATQSGAMPLSDEDPRRQPAEREQQRPRIAAFCVCWSRRGIRCAAVTAVAGSTLQSGLCRPCQFFAAIFSGKPARTTISSNPCSRAVFAMPRSISVYSCVSPATVTARGDAPRSEGDTQ
jgi:hypothetical protein